MLQETGCPCCGAQAWDELTERTFTRTGKRTAYVERRFRVLFEIWSPGADTLTLRYVLCRECGFVMYLPRPTAADLEAKYRYLTEHEKPVHDTHVGPADQRRSRDLFEILEPILPREGSARVLDVGGATGSLLHDLVRHGHHCAVVDYTRVTIPGVTRLGDTLEAIGAPYGADVAVCSHVLEHVVHPRALLEQAARHIRPGGALFTEVPVEIWGTPPRQREPVTHINFFSEGSLACCLGLAGYHVARCWTEAAVTGTGRPKLVARALASPGPAMPAWRLRESAHEARAMTRGGARWKWGGALRRAASAWLRM